MSAVVKEGVCEEDTGAGDGVVRCAEEAGEKGVRCNGCLVVHLGRYMRQGKDSAWGGDSLGPTSGLGTTARSNVGLADALGLSAPCDLEWKLDPEVKCEEL